jgi:DNA-binding Lrp family transcriptional regulator
MTGERIEMSQEERDRLHCLKLARDKRITQRQAAERMGVTERWVRQLLRKLKRKGDRAVVHGLRGKPSNHKIADAVRGRAVKLIGSEYPDFGPTLAAEYLAEQHGIIVGKETVRQWMIEAQLRRPKRAKISEVHVWRPRRECFGELVQWDTSEHEWLEGRGPKLYLVAMIDDATSRALARFVEHDTTAENMRLLWLWLEQYGRPLEYYTDKASLFHVNARLHYNKHLEATPALTQMGRALRELGIGWIPAHSAQAKGRIERFFETAQDRLVKGLRKAGVNSREGANEYVEHVYLPRWEERFTVAPANDSDAHRPLRTEHNLAAILSHVEERVIRPDYTFPLGAEHYQIAKSAIVARMRGTRLRVEQRLDGSVAVCWEGRYIEIAPCAGRAGVEAEDVRPAQRAAGRGERQVKRAWMEGFWERPAPPLWAAIRQSNRTS